MPDAKENTGRTLSSREAIVATIVQKPLFSGNDLFDVVGTLYKESLVAIAGNLIDGITTDRTLVQVAQNFQLIVEIQLLVQQLDQLLETACIHNASLVHCEQVPR